QAEAHVAAGEGLEPERQVHEDVGPGEAGGGRGEEVPEAVVKAGDPVGGLAFQVSEVQLHLQHGEAGPDVGAAQDPDPPALHTRGLRKVEPRARAWGQTSRSALRAGRPGGLPPPPGSRRNACCTYYLTGTERIPAALARPLA